MSSKYAKKDIYSKDGILLYAKGQELTSGVVSKLTDRGLLDQISQFTETAGQHNLDIRLLQHTEDQEISAAQKAESTAQINKLRKALKKSTNPDEMDICTEILASVLFAGPGHPWHIYIVTLWNHTGWIYTHSIDVALISLLIAYELGYRGKRLTEICIGTLLHDVGKVLIPKSILSKEEKDLNTHEMLILQHHCELGYDMAEDAGISETCRSIIYQHHERMDGSGYPRGLTASGISPEAQICMVADAIDLMTSFHPNNANWSKSGYGSMKELENTINELKEYRDQFPKDILDIAEKKALEILG